MQSDGWQVLTVYHSMIIVSLWQSLLTKCESNKVYCATYIAFEMCPPTILSLFKATYLLTLYLQELDFTFFIFWHFHGSKRYFVLYQWCFFFFFTGLTQFLPVIICWYFHRWRKTANLYWSEDILFFTYCVVSDMFTGMTQFLPVIALGPASFVQAILTNGL